MSERADIGTLIMRVPFRLRGRIVLVANDHVKLVAADTAADFCRMSEHPGRHAGCLGRLVNALAEREVEIAVSGRNSIPRSLCPAATSLIGATGRGLSLQVSIWKYSPLKSLCPSFHSSC